MSSRASSAPAPEAGAYFDERAARYDRAYDGPRGYPLRSRLEAALRLVGDGPGEALDAGMGPGRLLAELSRRGWSVSGIDASAEMVAVARRRLPHAAPRLLTARIESLPFDDASFDAVFATGVLEYSEVERALHELTRVLRPGGVAVVSYPNPTNFYGLWKTRVWYRLVRAAKAAGGRGSLDFPRGSRGISPARFRELLAGTGLEPGDVRHTSFLLVPSPLDELAPQVSERLGRRLEGSGGAVARRLAGQVVYAARKT